MILSQRGSCSPRSLGRRRGEVRVGVVITVIVIGVVLVLVLWVRILGDLVLVIVMEDCNQTSRC